MTSLIALTSPDSDGQFGYTRVDRADPRYRWWKPLAVAVVAFVFYLVLSVVVLVGVEAFAAVVLSPAAYAEHDRQITELNAVITDPLALVVLLGSIAVMTPALWLARLVLRAGPLGRLSSVAGRLRWRWLGLALLPATAYMAVQSLVSYVVAPALGAESMGEPTIPLSTFLISLAVIVVLVPFQASAEEYVFRGLVMQSVGGWVRFPLIAIIASAIPFVLGHAYNPWGLAEILVFALVAAWITIRTGGLEAAIGVHVLTNLVALSVPALGFSNVSESNGSPEGFVMALILLPLWAWGVTVLFRRSGISRRAAPAPVVALPDAVAQGEQH